MGADACRLPTLAAAETDWLSPRLGRLMLPGVLATKWPATVANEVDSDLFMRIDEDGRSVTSCRLPSARVGAVACCCMAAAKSRCLCRFRSSCASCSACSGTISAAAARCVEGPRRRDVVEDEDTMPGLTR